MALTHTVSVQISGYSVINGEQVMYLTANVSRDTAGSTYVNQTITNKELYNSNRTECRQDVADFQDKVYKAEDELLAEKPANSKTAK